MGSRDVSWASLDQSDSHVSSASLQLSRESLSTSESQPVDIDLLGGDLALSEDSSEDESDEVDSDSNSEKSEGEGEVDRNMEDLSCRIKELGARLDEPLKQGWRRECLLDGEKVLRVYYLSPATGSKGVRRRMMDRRSIARFLSKSQSNGSKSLLPAQFSFKLAPLRLAGGDERAMEAKVVEAPFSYKTDAIFHYWQELGGGGEVQRGRCLLCGSDKPLLQHKHFRTHMQTRHLPDETCDICGGDIRPCAFSQHWETCDGSLPSPNRAAQQKKLFRFWVEAPDASGSRRGRCLLCPSREKLVCHQAFIQHVQRYHLPEHECPVCGEAMSRIEVKQHDLLCTGRRRASSAPVIESATDPPLGDSFASVATHSTDKPGGKSPGCQSFASVDDFVEGKTPESSTSPANVSDLLRSSSPEPQPEAWTPENVEERPGHQSPTSDIKDEPRDMLEESMHIDESLLSSETVKNTVEDSSVIERKVDVESGELRGVPEKEDDAIKESRDNEEPVFVILVMKLEGYPVRKLRLKSTQGVIVAMKKFATASGLSYKQLRYFWQGRRLSGKEVASTLEGADEISVELKEP